MYFLGDQHHQQNLHQRSFTFVFFLCQSTEISDLKIHITTSQQVLLGFDISLITTPTAWSIHGLIQTIVYINLPMAEAYSVLAMDSLSSSFDNYQHI